MSYFDKRLCGVLCEARGSAIESKSGFIEAVGELKRAGRLSWEGLRDVGSSLSPTDLAQNWYTMLDSKQLLYAMLYKYAPSLFNRIPNEHDVARLLARVEREDSPGWGPSNLGLGASRVAGREHLYPGE